MKYRFCKMSEFIVLELHLRIICTPNIYWEQGDHHYIIYKVYGHGQRTPIKI